MLKTSNQFQSPLDYDGPRQSLNPASITPPTAEARWIRGNPLHNLLVLLDIPRKLPLRLVLLTAIALQSPTCLLFSPAWPAALIMGTACAGDLLLLWSLPRLRLSFGSIQSGVILFGTGRAMVGVLICVLPLSRSAVLLLLGMSQLALSLAALWGAMIEPFLLEETRLVLRPRGLAGPLRALLLSDLHIERLTRREERVLEAIRRERPDLILIGGDLLNLSYVDDELAAAAAREFISKLSAPSGVLFVRGTPEVDRPETVARVLHGSSVRCLEGETVAISAGATTITVLGLPADGSPERLEGWLAELARRPSRGPQLCLHHTPDLAPAAARLGIDLYLAGHTHGGQICLPWLGPLATASRFGRRYYRGYHRIENTHVYVSRGLGLEGLGAPRMRFLARPELTWIELLPET